MRQAILFVVLLLCGCDGETASEADRTGPVANRVEPDTRPAFVLDPSKPFVIELGRGSGLHGLDTIRINETGSVELHRVAGDAVESASLQMSTAEVKKLVGLVNSHQLTGLGGSYSNPSTSDGAQWVLWIQQSPSEKSVYFNNVFPDQITAFARDLDALIQNAGLGAASWRPVPAQQGADQQAALWARIQPAK